MCLVYPGTARRNSMSRSSNSRIIGTECASVAGMPGLSAVERLRVFMTVIEPKTQYA